jgi:hypothetical protein
MHVDMPDGSIDLGPATIDTNHDGMNDTAAVATNSGGTIAFTDKDGDRQADIAVQMDARRHTTTFEHTGDHQWTEVGTPGRPSSQWAGPAFLAASSRRRRHPLRSMAAQRHDGATAAPPRVPKGFA